MASWSCFATWYGEADLHERISKNMEGRINVDPMRRALKNLSFDDRLHPFNQPAPVDFTADRLLVSSSRDNNQAIVPALATPIPVLVDYDADDADADIAKDMRTRAAPYWVSVSKRRGFRRLHRRGGCWFAAELEEDVFDLGSAQFHARCGHCWRDALKPKMIGDDESVDSDEVSSSTDEA